MAELVDALDSKSSSFGSVGSIPTRGTKLKNKPLNNQYVKWLIYLSVPTVEPTSC